MRPAVEELALEGRAFLPGVEPVALRLAVGELTFVAHAVGPDPKALAGRLQDVKGRLRTTETMMLPETM